MEGWSPGTKDFVINPQLLAICLVLSHLKVVWKLWHSARYIYSQSYDVEDWCLCSVPGSNYWSVLSSAQTKPKWKQSIAYHHLHRHFYVPCQQTNECALCIPTSTGDCKLWPTVLQSSITHAYFPSWIQHHSISMWMWYIHLLCIQQAPKQTGVLNREQTQAKEKQQPLSVANYINKPIKLMISFIACVLLYSIVVLVAMIVVSHTDGMMILVMAISRVVLDVGVHKANYEFRRQPVSCRRCEYPNNRYIGGPCGGSYAWIQIQY